MCSRTSYLRLVFHAQRTSLGALLAARTSYTKTMCKYLFCSMYLILLGLYGSTFCILPPCPICTIRELFLTRQLAH